MRSRAVALVAFVTKRSQAPMTVVWLVLTTALLMVSSVSAQSTAAVEEPADPVLTEEALPSEVGEWEVRLTGDFSEDRIIAPKAQMFFGLVERLGGELATSFGDEDGSYGSSEVGGSLKWLALPARGSRPAVVVGLEVEATTGAGRNEVAAVPFVALLKVFEGVTVQGRIGPIWRVREGDEREEDERAVAFDVAVLVPVGPRLHFVGEGGQGEDPGYVAAGMRYQLTERLSLASSVPFHFEDQQVRFVLQLQAQFGER